MRRGLRNAPAGARMLAPQTPPTNSMYSLTPARLPLRRAHLRKLWRRAMRINVTGQARNVRQRLANFIVPIVQLHVEVLVNQNGDFKDVHRIQPQTVFPKNGRLGADLATGMGSQTQPLFEHIHKLLFGWRHVYSNL